MYVDHETMRAEIDRLGQFFHLHGDDPWLDHVAYALEDLPEDVREQARMIMDVPAGGSFAKRYSKSPPIPSPTCMDRLRR